MAMSLHLARPKHRSLTNPSLLHLFSTSSNVPNNENSTTNNDNHSNNNPPSISFYFSDVKASLRQKQQERLRNPTTPTYKHNLLSHSSMETIKSLSEFRRRSSVPPPTEPSSTSSQSQSQSNRSFTELYQRNVLKKQGESNEGTGSCGSNGKLPFDVIRKSNSGANNRASMRADFVKSYGYEELGKKLKQLRPQPKGGEGWFSFQELNERLMKLREMEERENGSRLGGIFNDLRLALSELRKREREN